MNTIKFESYDESYPLHEGTDRQKNAKSTSLKEGKDIWHRAFEIKTLEELQKWKHDHAWGAQHVTSLVPGIDPTDTLEEMKKNKGENSIYFEYMIFFDDKGELHKCIVFCCNCYIMNAEGQTVDSFAA